MTLQCEKKVSSFFKKVQNVWKNTVFINILKSARLLLTRPVRRRQPRRAPVEKSPKKCIAAAESPNRRQPIAPPPVK